MQIRVSINMISKKEKSGIQLENRSIRCIISICTSILEEEFLVFNQNF